MKALRLYFLLIYCGLFPSLPLNGQRPVPATPQGKDILLLGGTIHIGDGRVIEQGAVGFSQGRITYVGLSKNAIFDSSETEVIPVWGQHIYPGLIAPNATLGLDEIEQVRAVNDSRETGLFNPEVRAIIAYNTDSKIIPTIRSNGVLLAQITPGGGIISGRSSIVELDGWNWEDAAYKIDEGIHLNWPEMTVYEGGGPEQEGKRLDQIRLRLQEIRKIFEDAKAYARSTNNVPSNLILESMRGLFNRSLTLYVHASRQREIMAAIYFAEEFGCRMVLVGGGESWRITNLLKEKNIPVILTRPHTLPFNEDDDIDRPYKTPFFLQQAGVLFCLYEDIFWQQRNLPFQAGTAAAYGLNKEQALMSVSLNAAKILGIDKRLGTLDPGKDATLFVSKGDALDMRTNHLTFAFIRGKKMDLSSEQRELYERYMKKYGLKASD